MIYAGEALVTVHARGRLQNKPLAIALWRAGSRHNPGAFNLSLGQVAVASPRQKRKQAPQGLSPKGEPSERNHFAPVYSRAPCGAGSPFLHRVGDHISISGAVPQERPILTSWTLTPASLRFRYSPRCSGVTGSFPSFVRMAPGACRTAEALPEQPACFTRIRARKQVAAILAEVGQSPASLSP